MAAAGTVTRSSILETFRSEGDFSNTKFTELCGRDEITLIAERASSLFGPCLATGEIFLGALEKQDHILSAQENLIHLLGGADEPIPYTLEMHEACCTLNRAASDNLIAAPLQRYTMRHASIDILSAYREGQTVDSPRALLKEINQEINSKFPIKDSKYELYQNVLTRPSTDGSNLTLGELVKLLSGESDIFRPESAEGLLKKRAMKTPEGKRLWEVAQARATADESKKTLVQHFLEVFNDPSIALEIEEGGAAGGAGGPAPEVEVDPIEEKTKAADAILNSVGLDLASTVRLGQDLLKLCDDEEKAKFTERTQRGGDVVAVTHEFAQAVKAKGVTETALKNCLPCSVALMGLAEDITAKQEAVRANTEYFQALVASLEDKETLAQVKSLLNSDFEETIVVTLVDYLSLMDPAELDNYVNCQVVLGEFQLGMKFIEQANKTFDAGYAPTIEAFQKALDSL